MTNSRHPKQTPGGQDKGRGSRAPGPKGWMNPPEPSPERASWLLSTLHPIYICGTQDPLTLTQMTSPRCPLCVCAGWPPRPDVNPAQQWGSYSAPCPTPTSPAGR